MNPKRLLGIANTKELHSVVLEIHRINGTLEKSIAKDQQETVELSEIATVKSMVDKLKTEKKDMRQELDYLNKRFENALRGSTLMFSKPDETKSKDPERLKFEKRMERLRLKSEEMKYQSLTQNLAQNPKTDDVTTRSMTYATSIGLNMIVAPISFGAFVYFFAGQFIDFDEGYRGRRGEARRVLLSVLAGIFMLFVEMILYVIRSHQLEESVRSKQKKATPSPFGRPAPIRKPEETKLVKND
eukprot:CAMPEP_0196812884 /NCGR_PEP_ID=MMETSP1362-20130617/32057_1 /TAXON_ID=163516 /ORGANISM="Leptocylindrus danicus, Strain CCMP1856" /LENGTH=242 /DNA_ID=CAMNT_0042188827 /DNA_START=53 /DNA_END=781 /DNA_ORIENTATION=-